MSLTDLEARLHEPLPVHERVKLLNAMAEQLYEVHGNRGEDPTDPPASAPYPYPALRHEPRIQQLSDEEALRGGSSQREAITALGLQHSLLTQYTSFIAVDHVVRNLDTDNNRISVQQPSPLPQGVSNHAIGTLGAAVPSTPEPAAWLALLVALGLVVAGVAHVRRYMEPPSSLSLATPQGGRPPMDRQSRIHGGKLGSAGGVSG